MKFNSTAGRVCGQSFRDAVFAGYAADGGILMPESIPRFTTTEIEAMKSMSYVGVVKEVASKFISPDEIPTDDLNHLVDEAFAAFPPSENIAPLTHLRDDLAVLELFHGRTMAFKDYAMTCVAQFVKYFAKKKRQRAVCLISTSGDTGSAALEAFKDQEFVDIVVMLPKDRCSRIQELQMTTVCGRNTHVIRADGTSDDIDVPMKTVMTDKEMTGQACLFSANSINFGRIMIQIAHHVYAYLQASSNFSGRVQVVIPSGALGNVTSGCFARAMGIPVEFILCTNANDIAHQMLLTGCMKVKEKVIPTCSYAMNIQNPYNAQRIWWLHSTNKEIVTKLADTHEKTNNVTIPEDIMKRIRQSIVDSKSLTDEEVLATMSQCWKRHSYLVCPHTACGLAYCLDRVDKDVKRVVIATASPEKFPEVVEKAGLPFQGNLLNELNAKDKKFEDWSADDDWAELLKQKIKSILGQ